MLTVRRWSARWQQNYQVGAISSPRGGAAMTANRHAGRGMFQLRVLVHKIR